MNAKNCTFPVEIINTFFQVLRTNDDIKNNHLLSLDEFSVKKIT